MIYYLETCMCVNDIECMCDYKPRMEKRVNIKAKSVNVSKVKNGPKPQRKIKPRNRRFGGSNLGRRVMAPVALSNMEARGGRSPPSRINGNDEIVQVSINKEMKSGHVLLEYDIDPMALAGASDVAKAFQFVRYQFLKIIITAKNSTTVDGGYVVAYINDPQDSLPVGYAAVQYAKANKYCSNNFWNSGHVICNIDPRRKFYTNPPVQGDSRWSSPGKIVLLVDQPTSQDALHLTVQAEYRLIFDSKTKNFSGNEDDTIGLTTWETPTGLNIDTTKFTPPENNRACFSPINGATTDTLPEEVENVFLDNPKAVFFTNFAPVVTFSLPTGEADEVGQNTVAGFTLDTNASSAPYHFSDLRPVSANGKYIGDLIIWYEKDHEGDYFPLFPPGTTFRVITPNAKKEVRRVRNLPSYESKVLMKLPDGSIRSRNQRTLKLRNSMNLLYSLEKSSLQSLQEEEEE